MIIPFWSRLRLAPRIVLVIIGALLAMKAVDKAMPLVIRPPEAMFFDRDWLLATLQDIRDRSVTVPAAERPALLRDLPARQWLDITLLEQSAGFPSFRARRRVHRPPLADHRPARPGAAGSAAEGGRAGRSRIFPAPARHHPAAAANGYHGCLR